MEPPTTPSPSPFEEDTPQDPRDFDRMSLESFRDRQAWSLTRLQAQQEQDVLGRGLEERQKEAAAYKATPWMMSGTYDTSRALLNGANNLAVSVHDFALHAGLGMPPAKSYNWGLNAFGDQDTILGPIIRDFAQFGIGFGKVKAGHSAIKRSIQGFHKKRGLKEGEKPWVLEDKIDAGTRARKWSAIFLEGAFLGGMTDFIAWDPRQPNLTGTILESAKTYGWDEKMPGFSDMVKDMGSVPIEDWEKDKMTLEKQFAYRFATMAEGVLMGGVANTVWKGLKFAYLQRQVKIKTAEYIVAEDALENLSAEFAKANPSHLKQAQKAVTKARKDFEAAYDSYALTGKEFEAGKRLLTKRYANASTWIGPNPSKTLGPDVAQPRRTARELLEEDLGELASDLPPVEPTGQARITKAEARVKKLEDELKGLGKRKDFPSKTTKKQYKKDLEKRLSRARGALVTAQSEAEMFNVTFPVEDVSKLETKLEKLIKDSPESPQIKILEEQIADTLAGPAVRDVPLSSGKMEWERNSLAILSDDGKVISMDREAIADDWINNGAGALRGQMPDSAGKSTKANMEEIQLWNDMGVDPNKIRDEIIQISRRVESDPNTRLELQIEMYEKFLELRLRWSNKLMKNAGMELEHLSPHFDSTNNILMEAQHNALFLKPSEGGLGFIPDNVIAADATNVRSKHPDVTLDALKDRLFTKDELGNPVGLEKLLSTFDALKKGEIDAADILDLFEEGQLINFKTMDMSPEVRSVMAGVATVWDDIFKLQFPKRSDEDHLARLYGWKGLTESGTTARKYIQKTLLNDLELIAKAADKGAEDVEHLFKTGDAVTFRQGQNLANLKVGDTPLPDLEHNDLVSLSARVMAYRHNVFARLGGLHKWHDEMLEKTGNLSDISKMTSEDKMELLTQLEPLFAELHGVSEAAHQSSQVMRSLREWKYLTRHNLPDVHGVKPFSDDEMAQVADAILEARLGGEDEIGRIMTVIQQVKADGKQLSGTAFEASMREINLLKEVQKRDIIGAGVEASISAMLSGLDTQVVNSTSGVMMSFLQNFESYIGSYTPKWWGRNKGVAPKLFLKPDALEAKTLKEIDGYASPEDAERAYVRYKALKNMTFQARIMFDMARMMIRTSDAPHAMSGDDLRLSQLQRAKDDVGQAAKSIENSQASQVLGGHKFRELMPGNLEGGYNSEAMWGVAKLTAHDAVGQAAYEWVRKQGLGKAGELAAEMYNSIYRVVKTPLNFLVANDQALKYSVINADTHATLSAYAHVMLNMPEEQIGEWVQKAGQGMIRENGSLFSEASLRAEALDILDKKYANRVWAEGEKTGFINDHVKNNWDLKDPDTGELIIGGEMRAKVAQESFDKAQRSTFTTDLAHDKNRRYKNIKEAQQQQASEGVIGPVPKEPGPTMVEAIATQAVENPLYKGPFTFVTVPWNIMKSAFDRAPGIAQWTHRNQADMLSSNPEAFHSAKGRKVMSATVLGLAYMAVTKGRFTGSGSRDPRQRAVHAAAGFKKYTWTSENGVHYDLSRMEPFNIPFKIAANVKENLDFAENDPESLMMIDQYASAMIGAFAESLTDSTYMQGVTKLGLLFHDLTDEDDRTKALSKFVDDTMFSFTKVRALSQIGEAADSKARQFNNELPFLERQFLATLFPWKAPPRRDPIFGYIIEKHPSYPNKYIQMLTPIKRTEQFVISPVYQELAALHAGANRINPNIDGNTNLNSARAFANLEVILPPTGAITDRKELRLRRGDRVERSLKNAAKTFVAPGGASCPIAQGQSYNDFEQQYISVRKVNWHKITKLKEWKENIPSEWDIETEGYKKLVKLFDSVQADKRLDHEVDLETLLLALASSKEYKAFSKEPNKFTNELSYCRQILAAEIRAFRNDARKELWGEPVDLDNSEKMDIGYSGMVTTFWPKLAFKRLFIKEQKLKAMGIDPDDVNPVIQQQKQQGAIKGILDVPNKKK